MARRMRSLFLLKNSMKQAWCSKSYGSLFRISFCNHKNSAHLSRVSSNSARELVGEILLLQQQADIKSFQQAVDYFSRLLTDDIFKTENFTIRMLSIKLIQLNAWIIRYSIHQLFKLKHVSHRRTVLLDAQTCANGSHLTETELFPPKLIYSMFQFILAWRKLQFYVRGQKQCGIPSTSIARLVHGCNSAGLKRLLALLRIRLAKIIPHMNLHEGASIIYIYSLIQPKDSNFVKHFAKHLNKKLWYLTHTNAMLGPHETAEGIVPEKALLIILAMARTKTPAVRYTHELAHALLPVVVTRYLDKLSTCQVVQLFSTFAKYQLQNQYRPLLYRFGELVKDNKAETRHLVTAITSIVKIPETPVEVIIFLYHALVRNWKTTLQNQNEGLISFRPLINLIETDFSCWDNTFEMVMTAMQDHMGAKIEHAIQQSHNQISLQRDTQEMLGASIDVLHGLAIRGSAVPPHPFTNLILHLNIVHLRVLSNRNLSRFLKSMALLSFSSSACRPLVAPGDIYMIVGIVLESLDRMDTRGLPYAIFLLSLQKPQELAVCHKNALIRKWISSNVILSGKTLAMSIHGLGSMELSINKMQMKAIASICERRLIRTLDCKQIISLCIGLKNLHMSIEEYPEPYLHCMRRSLELCDSMDIAYLPQILLTLAQCGLFHNKLNRHAMNRIMKEKECLDFDIFLEITEALISVLGKDCAHYGDHLSQFHKFIRDKVLQEIHHATPLRCVRMMNTCSIFMPYDTAVIRSIAFAMNTFRNEMIPYVSTSKNSSVQILTNTTGSQDILLTSPSLLSILPYTSPLTPFETYVVAAIRARIAELQPSELQRLMYITIGPMCDSLQPARAIQYVSLYKSSRWMVIDSLLDSRSDLSPKALTLRKVYPESMTSLLLSMCDHQVCDLHFLRIFLRAAKNVLQRMHVGMLIICVSCLSELRLLHSKEFRFFIKVLRRQSEIRAEDFNAGNICAFLHLLWANEIRTSSRLTASLGERAIEISNF